jgi:hypothetical protein
MRFVLADSAEQVLEVALSQPKGQQSKPDTDTRAMH